MRGMNGSSGASPERGYSGIPAQVGPPMGGGPGGNAAAPSLHSQAAAAAAGLGGPELKHHADFLSRLLAATPSYLSEMGNPPPGFFSDWLRRLVSKPGGTSQSSLLTFPGQPPEAENSGRSAAPSNPPDTQQVSSKRRKRSRLNDRHAEHPNLMVPGRNTWVGIFGDKVPVAIAITRVSSEQRNLLVSQVKNFGSGQKGGKVTDLY
ncbi:hypothetical protein Fcan01_02745 [Folsomia candida]|uniref:Uncharacterized protein n=1 Tax=Folsomia candida TaxID=158441 RepID=A0A226F5C7_FOLCA|nr:hypothetical protein Fcan01_02745 [Folsomia candida]